MQKVDELISRCGGVASPKLRKVITSHLNWEADELLLVKLSLAFSANLNLDFIHKIVLEHSCLKTRIPSLPLSYSSCGQLLSSHFSQSKITRFISTLSGQECEIYLGLLPEVYQSALLLSNPKTISKLLHRHLKNIRQVVESLNIILASSLEPDEELPIQRELYSLLTNHFIGSNLQLSIPLTYGELKDAGIYFNNCLGDARMKRRVVDRDLFLVFIKKHNELYAVMDVLPNFEIKTIATFYNRGLPLVEFTQITQEWTNKFKPRLMKNMPNLT